MPGLRHVLLTLLVMCIACGKRPVAKPIARRDLGLGEAEVENEAFDVLRVPNFEPPSKLAPMLERAADEHAKRFEQLRARMKAAEAVPRAPAPPWPTDYAAARARADAEHKPLLLIIGATWTAGSAYMEHTTLQHPSSATC